MLFIYQGDKPRIDPPALVSQLFKVDTFSVKISKAAFKAATAPTLKIITKTLLIVNFSSECSNSVISNDNSGVMNIISLLYIGNKVISFRLLADQFLSGLL